MVLRKSGLIVTDVPLPAVPVTVKVAALLHVPPCCTRATPLSALEATVAMSCVSLQLETTPAVLPSHSCPLLCVEPNPDPKIVMVAPAAPEFGVMLTIRGLFT